MLNKWAKDPIDNFREPTHNFSPVGLLDLIYFGLAGKTPR